MDLRYLLWLQEIRFALGSGAEVFFISICKGYTLILMALIPVIIYWIYDKKTGMRMLLTICMANFFNGLLKILFCVYRPWIREPRIKPNKKAIKDATGYSFPSGHATVATSFFGLSGWLVREKRPWLTALLWLYCGLLMFSRNYLGVHTPQDVAAGSLLGIAAIAFTSAMLKFADYYEHGDRLILLGGLFLMAVVILIIQVKPYPLNYVNGQLLVDPEEMRIDSFRQTGIMMGALLGWYMEKNYLAFDAPENGRERVVRCVIGFSVLMAALGLALLLEKLLPVAWITESFLGGSVLFAGTYLAPKLFMSFKEHSKRSASSKK